MNKTPLEKLFFSKTRDFLDLYLSSQCSKSKHTIKAYRDALTVFRKYVVKVRNNSIKTFTFDDCTREFILDFMEYLQKAASTTIYSIIQTAIVNNLKPQKYLEYVFTRVQYGDDKTTLTPWSDNIPEYCKNKKSQ